jgi:hypothetical protein
MSVQIEENETWLMISQMGMAEGEYSELSNVNISILSEAAMLA